MTLLRSILLYFFALALGVATMAAIGYRWLPYGVIAVVSALIFVLMLPRQPRFVAACCVGAALPVAFVLVDPAWDNCAHEVRGELIEYKCTDGPPSR